MKSRSFAFLFGAFVLALQLVVAPLGFAADGSVTPEQGKALIDEKKDDIVILDVRTPEEHAGPHYNSALNISVKELEDRVTEVPAGKPVLIHCAKGLRAERALKIIKDKRSDITDVQFIKGEPIFE